MKFLPTQFFYFMRSRVTQRNLGVLARFLAVLVGMVASYSVLFHRELPAETRGHVLITSPRS